MGLDDIIPDKADTPSRSSSGGRTSSQEKEFVIDVGSGDLRKRFTEEKWEDVKQVIIEEFGMVPNEVLNSPSQERFEILHEAALVSEKEKKPTESQLRSEIRCYYCGKACNGSHATIGGETFCLHHTVAQVEKSLNE